MTQVLNNMPTDDLLKLGPALPPLLFSGQDDSFNLNDPSEICKKLICESSGLFLTVLQHHQNMFESMPCEILATAVRYHLSQDEIFTSGILKILDIILAKSLSQLFSDFNRVLATLKSEYEDINGDPQYSEQFREQNKYNSKYLAKRMQVTNWELFLEIVSGGFIK